jgi:N-acetylglucosamine-6-sulfatase
MHFAHHDNPAHYGIRTADHKLIFFYGLPLDAKGAVNKPTPPYWELYDLRQDPKEMRNVYSSPEYAMVRRDLQERLHHLKAQVGDTDDTYPELVQRREATR